MLRIFLLLGVSVALTACTAASSRQKGKPLSVRQETVRLSIKADPQLNRFEKNAHTLFLCLYQLKDPDTFSHLSRDREGLWKLMECSRFDATVANARQLVVQPGENLDEAPVRAEGTRFIGVAAGYFGLGKEKVTDLVPLPASAGDSAGMTIRIELGPHRIHSVQVK